MTKDRKEMPFVSVIMPIRNEAGFIEQAILSILNNDYPRDLLEILVIDGNSTDGTREIVTKLQKLDHRIRLIDNHRRTVPYAMNLGLRQMRGSLFIRIDGHVTVPTDFIRNSVECLLEKSDAWVAGGSLETVSNTYIGKAIAIAMQSPFGVGNAMFRRGNYEGWVDTLAFGTHHRWVVDKVGYFDEELIRNQDDDFNFRILKAGGKIWLSKNIKAIYYSRSSLRKLWKQYFQYGFWRIRTIQKHKQVATLRQLAPIALVLSIAGLGLLSLLHPLFLWLFAIELVIYALGLLWGAIEIARKFSFKYAILAPLIFIILHLSYGIGSVWGIIRFVLLKGKYMPKPENHELSR